MALYKCSITITISVQECLTLFLFSLKQVITKQLTTSDYAANHVPLDRLNSFSCRGPHMHVCLATDCSSHEHLCTTIKYLWCFDSLMVQLLQRNKWVIQ